MSSQWLHRKAKATHFHTQLILCSRLVRFTEDDPTYVCLQKQFWMENARGTTSEVVG